MATTENLGITKIESAQAQPEVPANAAIDALDKAIAGKEAIDAAGSGDLTLTSAQQLAAVLVVEGALTGARAVIVSTEKLWHVRNATTGEHALTVKTASGAGVVVPQGGWRTLFNDGTDVVEVARGGAPALSLLDLTDTPSAYTGKAGQALLVKLTEDGTEFGAVEGGGGGGASAFTDLTDAFPDYTGRGGHLLKIADDEEGLESVEPVTPEAASMSQVIGDGVETVFAITHDFGARDVVVMVRETASPYARIESGYSVQFTDPNNVALEFDVAPASSEYTVFIAVPWILGGTVTPAPGTAVYETAGEFEHVVPEGVTAYTGKGWGAGGGGTTNPSAIGKAGGGGGFAQCTFAVTPGEVLTIKIGAGGAGYTYVANQSNPAGGGGGLTGIFRGSTPLLIAGSGGGAGCCNSSDTNDTGAGGAGGGSSGGGGGNGTGSFGGNGGNQVGGGAGAASSAGTNGTNGTALTGGSGGYANTDTYDGYGGSGGAGYFGGGGGGADSDASSANADAGGGGGGSGYVSGVSTTLTAGSGQNAANTADSDYGLLFAGQGGGGGVSGNPGRIVISWS